MLEHHKCCLCLWQGHPQLAQVLQSCGGSIVADALHGKATLVVRDEDSSTKNITVPAHAEELCVTSVGLMLVSYAVLHHLL